MTPAPPYVILERAVPPELCALAIAAGKALELAPARLDPEPGQRMEDPGVRAGAVGWFDPRHWIAGVLTHFAAVANADAWRLPLSVAQDVQFTAYGPGGRFDWHRDAHPAPFDHRWGDPAWVGQVRRISVTVQLSPADAYAGGDLRFRDDDGRELVAPGDVPRLRAQGSVIAFPSDIVHTVTPINAGERCSAVSWILGPP